MRSFIDVTAEAIRTAFGESQKDENPHLYQHVRSTPWESMPEHRKEKWLAMAEAAYRVFMHRELKGR